MNLHWLVPEFILIPLAGFLLSLLLPEKPEKQLSNLAYLTTGMQLLMALVFLGAWTMQGFPTLNIKELVLYQRKDYEFLIDLYFDQVGAVYLLTGALLTFLITVYSRYYLHREQGYKRFFNTILFFQLGYNITILSGNFETLFIGWEFLGISSFLLIAFYRERYLPVRNAVKVFSIYRIGDVGIILAMWASHHLWHENITFMKLNNYELVHEHLLQHSSVGVFISLMILIAAAAKSAQLPFSSWLPRAMEGPTPSSAIFYGSLSVHFGVFLLLRTEPFWEHQISVRVIIALLGVTTSLVANSIARVQSTVKSQIAYSSISQIGIIFVELGFGLSTLALLHFAGNAFLRTYQLLVSPSMVSYRIREQFYSELPGRAIQSGSLPGKLKNSLFLLSLKEWNLDPFINRLAFSPFKKLGHKLDFINIKNFYSILLPGFFVGLGLLFVQEQLPAWVNGVLPSLLAGIALLLVLKSFSERQSPLLSWKLMLMNHCWMALAISFNEHFDYRDTLFYLSGVLVSAAIGYYVLRRMQHLEKGNFDLNRYYGHVYEHPKLALLFLLSSLGLMGFPITPTFIGEDLIFSHIREDQFVLALFNSLCFILGGISLIRVYARLFLGQHIKPYHELPYRSS